MLFFLPVTTLVMSIAAFVLYAVNGDFWVLMIALSMAFFFAAFSYYALCAFAAEQERDGITQIERLRQDYPQAPVMGRVQESPEPAEEEMPNVSTSITERRRIIYRRNRP